MGSKKFIQNSVLIISLSVFFITILVIPSIHATDMYADIQITVDNAGFTSIEGKTNDMGLLVQNTEEFTSKQQSIWTLNITRNVIYSDFVFSIILPEYSQINTVISSGSTFISDESGNLIISGYGSNSTLSIMVQYQTKKALNENKIFEVDTISIILIVCIIILVICFLVVLLFNNKKNSQLASNDPSQTSYKQMKGLNERQKDILQLLEGKNTALTQTDIQKELNLPKASVSRNIRRLELKGLIEKEQIGMSNLIRLKK